MVNEEEEQYYQNYDKAHPAAFGYEQPTKQIPQNMYQSTPMHPGAYPPNRYSQAESTYGQPLNPYAGRGEEKELAGYSEQIMSSAGMPPYMTNQSMYNPNYPTNIPQDPYGYKPFPVDPKASLFNPNLSMNIPPNLLYPNQYTPQPLYASNTFGTDPNMSLYHQKEFQPLQDPYAVDPFSSPNRAEVDFMSEKLTKVQQMYDTLKKEYDEQKKFYDEALEARTNQLEEAENEVEKVKGELELAKKTEIDLKAKHESLKFDNEMLGKRIETTSQDKTNASQREEGLLKQLDEVNSALKQKESVIEQKVDENFGLKQNIDRMKGEADKARKRIEGLEDMLRGKDAEIAEMEREIGSCKGEINAMANKEKGLLRENDAIKNELNALKSQLHTEKERNEHLFRDLNGIKEALSQSQNREQSSRNAHESVKRELEATKNQLTQANSYIQSQDSTFRNLQRDYDMIKSTNMDLKSQLEQAKMQANYAQQQMAYQPPPTQYRPPPQFETFNQYKSPPQFNYAPPATQEQAYPAAPSYQPKHEYKTDFEQNTPPKLREQSWESESGSYKSYKEPSRYDSPPKEEYKAPPKLRSSYTEDPSESKYQSQALDFQPKGQGAGVEQAYQTKIHHSQSTMGSLLTWGDQEKQSQGRPTQPKPQRQPIEIEETQKFQPPPRSAARSGQEQPTQW